MTTADLRKLAQQAERELRWRDAWTLWTRAIAAYPAGGGELAAHDKRRMAERAMACKDSAE